MVQDPSCHINSCAFNLSTPLPCMWMWHDFRLHGRFLNNHLELWGPMHIGMLLVQRESIQDSFSFYLGVWTLENENFPKLRLLDLILRWHLRPRFYGRVVSRIIPDVFLGLGLSWDGTQCDLEHPRIKQDHQVFGIIRDGDGIWSKNMISLLSVSNIMLSAYDYFDQNWWRPK